MNCRYVRKGKLKDCGFTSLDERNLEEICFKNLFTKPVSVKYQFESFIR